jgi:hypothetical protein
MKSPLCFYYSGIHHVREMSHNSCRLKFNTGLCGAIMSWEANKYHGYARECLKLAETAHRPDHRKKLIELSKVWLEAALNEERHHLNRIAGRASTSVGSMEITT